MITFTSVLDGGELTLAEQFKARGYETAAVIANSIVQDRFGFAQGFDAWTPVLRRAHKKGEGDQVNAAAFQWLDRRTDRTRPVFLYVHYMEPHPPYYPAADLLARQLDGRPAPDAAEVNRHMLAPLLDVPDALVPAIRTLYDAEVAAADRAVGQLVAGLRTRGLLENAVIALLADHGEGFKEHGIVGHRETLYEEVVRVPLIIAATARPAGRSVDEIASVVDIAPTLLALAREPIPASYEGRSRAEVVGPPPWWHALRARRQDDPPTFCELIRPETDLRLSLHERAVVRGEHKAIETIDGERSYYDLAADPTESAPDALPPPGRAELDRALQRLHQYRADAAPPRSATLDAGTEERMRALGYAQ
jgi:arylsulfatase A-like enzyme